MILTIVMGVILLNKLFHLLKWQSLEMIKKDSRVQNEISQTIEKYNKESYSTQSKLVQNALIRSKVFEQAINIMRDTIEDMDIEIEHKDNKIEFLENKIGLPDCKVIEMNKVGLTKISS